MTTQRLNQEQIEALESRLPHVDRDRYVPSPAIGF